MKNGLARQNRNRSLREKRFLFLAALFFSSFCCVYIAAFRGSLSLFFIVLLGLVFVLKILRDEVFGLVIAIAFMNNGYSLMPRNISGGSMLSSLWDFGFIILMIATLRYFPNILAKRDENIPMFVIWFYSFLGIVAFSFVVSLVSLPYPVVDTFRTFRIYLGYLLAPLLIVIFDKEFSTKLNDNFYKLLHLISYICFILLVLYNLQFLLKYQVFVSKLTIYESGGQSYIRSIPTFFMLSYFFFWIFLAEWLGGKILSLWKITYIILSFSATMFTFTRGIYISIALLLFLLLAIMVKSKNANMARFCYSVFLLTIICSILFLSSLADPYLERIQSTSSDLQATGKKSSTSRYRMHLVEDRIRIVKNNNPLIGIGFVHPKYAFRDYGPFRGNHLPGEEPGIWCADIAWANIIYQTGILGVSTFVLFIGALLLFIYRKLPLYTGDLFYLQLASCFELLRNIILMFIGASYTDQTQNVAFFLGISAYIHIVHSRRARII